MSTSEQLVKFARLYTDDEDDYLFISKAGAGVQNNVERVLHLKTGEVRVRKIPKHRAESDLITPPRDVECEIVVELQILMDKTPQTELALTSPRINRLYSTWAVPSPLEPSSDDDGDENGKYDDVKWWQASYWAYANCGSLRSFLTAIYYARMPPPLRLVARCMAQVLSTVQFMYKVPEIPYVHRDLHMGNILVHWEPGSEAPDFYVADFGNAFRHNEIVDRQEGPCWDGEELAFELRTMLGEDTLQRKEFSHECELMKAGAPDDRHATIKDKIARARLLALAEELNDLDHFLAESDCYALPDLTEFIKTARAVERDLENQPLTKVRQVFDDKIEEAKNLRPLLYDTEEEAAGDKTRPGQWQVAKVDEKTLEVLEVCVPLHMCMSISTADSEHSMETLSGASDNSDASDGTAGNGTQKLKRFPFPREPREPRK